MLPSLRYALHPILPVRLGFRRLLGLTNPALATVLSETDGFTLVPARSRVTLARVAQGVLDAGVEGSFAEFGVLRGGTAGILASLLRGSDRELHLFDRWGALVQPTDEDGHQKHRYTPDNIPAKLRDLAARPPLDLTRELVEQRMRFNQVRYYQGFFEDTLSAYAGGPIAFASVDCDFYESVKLVLDFIRRNASPGCVILVDDYSDDWPGAKKATDEFCRRHGHSPEFVLSQAIIRL